MRIPAEMYDSDRMWRTGAPLLPMRSIAPRVTLLGLVGVVLALVLATFRLFAATLEVISHNSRAIIALAALYAFATCAAGAGR